MQRERIGVLVSGGGTNLQSLIDVVEQGSINGEIVLVVSDNNKAYAMERAKRHGIESCFIDKKSFNDKASFAGAIADELEKKGVTLVVLAGFMSILHSDLVNLYQGRMINIHPALIPSFCGNGYYGERVHKAALEYGVKVSGATVHFVDEGTDSGPIIMQGTVNVDIDDTPETLAAKVLKVEHQLLPEAVRLFCEGKLVIEGRRVRIIKD